MKTFRHPQIATPAGSVLITTLLFAMLLGTALASYLLMVRGQNISVARSQAWHSALTVAEAGVEEALAQLNPGALTTKVMTGNGWALVDGLYRPDPPERELLGGRYAVGYTPSAPPVIYSTGYVAVPVSGDIVSRVIRVETTNASLYRSQQIAATIDQQFSGRQLYTNSYSSINPTYITVNKALTATSGNADLPDVLPPYIIALPLPSNPGGQYTLSGDYLVQGNLSLGSNEKIYVAPNRTATLYVKGDVQMNAGTKLEIAAGGALKMFVGGDNTTLGSIDNHGAPANFQYYGLPGNTNISLAGKSNLFIGILYAPNANFTTTSTINFFDFWGALTVDTFTLQRNFRLHFDEDLLDHGPRRGFVAASWREL